MFHAISSIEKRVHFSANMRQYQHRSEPNRTRCTHWIPFRGIIPFPAWKASQVTVTILLVFLLTFAQGQGHGDTGTLDDSVEFDVWEERTAGEYVGTIPVQSGLRYRFSEDPTYFILNPDTGVIHTTSVIDRESLERDWFDLFVQSSPLARHLVEVRINVLDINDNSPLFGQPAIEISFSERDQPGTQAILDTATDPDSGVNDVRHRYQIISGNGDGKFRLILLTDTSRPLLYLENVMELDREEQDFYQLNISVQDGGSPPRYGFLRVNITIRDFNDNNPVFDQSDYSVTLNETVPTGTTVLQVHATDQDVDQNQDITYSIVNQGDTVQFGIDPVTGVITTLTTLNCYRSCDGSIANCKPKSCFLTVEAEDNGRPFPLTGRAYVTISLIDENDHSPVIEFQYVQSTKSYATVDEGARVDNLVALIEVSDQDDGLNGQTTVHLVGGNSLGHFRLDTSIPGLNLVKVSGQLDRERISRYNLTIIARDLGNPPRMTTAFLVIRVNDINDHRPEFAASLYEVSLSELVPVGTFVSSPLAMDNDTGVNAEITYAIASGNNNGWFQIDSSTGLVVTKTALDREMVSEVFLHIQAEDGAAVPYTASTELRITIWDENDESPEFSSDYYNVTMTEGAESGTEVMTVTAYDRDEGVNGTVRYFFDPDVEIQYPGLLQLNQITGRISLLYDLDKEQYSNLQITVVAADQGQPQLSSSTIIYVHILDINDNAPIFYPQVYYATIQENEPAYTSVVQVTATDADSSDTGAILYSFTTGSDQFSINIQTGWISTREQLDRESRAVYQLTVTARDAGNQQALTPATVEILVGDVQDTPPVFSRPDGYSFTVMENAEQTNNYVGTIRASTSDGQGGVTYDISGGDPEGYFIINGQSGRMSTARPLDRELQDSYQIQVTAMGGQTFSQTTVNVTVLDVNDNTPRFSHDRIQVFAIENWPIGHGIHVAEADDPDIGDNGTVHYSLLPGSSPVFTINEDSGVIVLAQSLQHINETSFEITVMAADNGSPSKSSRQDILVLVEDVNDHTPRFERDTYEVSISESQTINDRFFRVISTDADTGQNGDISYDIVYGNEAEMFGIFPDGVLYVARSLDRESQPLYLLSVRAMDNGIESRMSIANVTIHVLDANDNPPVFMNETYNFVLLEGSAVSTSVGVVQAVDADIGSNAEISYNIDGTSSGFVIHPKTGMISSNLIYDRETVVADTGSDVVTITVLAEDGGVSSLSSRVPVHIRIADINDDSPAFTQALYEASVFENEGTDSVITQVSARDADSGPNADITYMILPGESDAHFRIDSQTGQLFLASMLDRETQQEHRLTVSAVDGGEPPLSSITEIRIRVEDVNDNAPVFVLDQSRVEILETASVGDFVAQVSALDLDYGTNSLLSYRISSGNSGTAFQIGVNTGHIYVSAPLDYESQNIYRLNITSTDSGSPPLSSSVTLTIVILDYNDNAPVFTSSAIVSQIQENVEVGTSVVTVTAADPDDGNNGQIRYTIRRQQPRGNHFAIDEASGEIQTNAAIDHEFTESFTLTVVATDQALPLSTRRATEKIVTVIVRDQNDNAPEFVSTNAAPVRLDALPNTLISEVRAEDPDMSENGQLEYRIFNGDTNLFRIDSNTGFLYLKSTLSNQVLTYALTIVANDNGFNDVLGRKSTHFQMTVFAVSDPEEGPNFTRTSYSGQVYENEAVGTSIVTVSASYSAGSSAEVEYFLSNIVSDGEIQPRHFQVNPTTGVVSTADVLDREAGYEVFQVEVYAVDRSSNTPKTRRTLVSI